MRNLIILVTAVSVIVLMGYDALMAVVLVTAGVSLVKTWVRPTFGRVIVTLFFTGWAATVIIGFFGAMLTVGCLFVLLTLRSVFS